MSMSTRDNALTALTALNKNRFDGYTTIDIDFINEEDGELLVKLTNEDNSTGEWSDFTHPLSHSSWTRDQHEALLKLAEVG